MTAGYAIGVDLGGTRVKAVALSPEGAVLDRRMAGSEAVGGGWVQRVVHLVSEMQQARGTPADALGIAAPGIAQPDGQAVWWMQGRVDAVQGLAWSKHFANFRAVINDGQAALMGEIAAGAAKGCANVIMLTLGTGVGGAVVCDGRLLRGAIGRAGHLGHITVDAFGTGDIVGTPGSLEDAIGNCTIVRRSGGRFTSTWALLDAVRAGDARAAEIWHISVRQLAAGIASLINVLDPELVIVGGGIAEAGEPLFTPLRMFLDEYEWRPHGRRARIIPATGGEFTGAIGAAFHALKAEPT